MNDDGPAFIIGTIVGLFLGGALGLFIFQDRVLNIQEEAVNLNYAEYKVVNFRTGATEFTWKTNK